MKTNPCAKRGASQLSQQLALDKRPRLVRAFFSFSWWLVSTLFKAHSGCASIRTSIGLHTELGCYTLWTWTNSVNVNKFRLDIVDLLIIYYVLRWIISWNLTTINLTSKTEYIAEYTGIAQNWIRQSVSMLSRKFGGHVTSFITCTMGQQQQQEQHSCQQQQHQHSMQQNIANNNVNLNQAFSQPFNHTHPVGPKVRSKRLFAV